MDFVSKITSLLFNILSRFLIAFLPRSKRLLISWLQSPSAVILEPKKTKSVTVSTFFPYICHEVMGLDAMILVFWILSFKPTFSLSSYLSWQSWFHMNMEKKEASVWPHPVLTTSAHLDCWSRVCVHSYLMSKTQLLCTLVPNQISETDFWVKYKRMALLFCQAKRDIAGSCSQNRMYQRGEDSDMFYSKRGHDQLMDILPVGRWVR